jgi:predicted ATP-binding protein involved in virulence
LTCALQIRGNDPTSTEKRRQRLNEAAEVFQKTLAIDSENVDAHYNLSQLYAQLDNEELAAFHKAEHEKYRIDDTARGEAVTIAAEKVPCS